MPTVLPSLVPHAVRGTGEGLGMGADANSKLARMTLAPQYRHCLDIATIIHQRASSSKPFLSPPAGRFLPIPLIACFFFGHAPPLTHTYVCATIKSLAENQSHRLRITPYPPPHSEPCEETTGEGPGERSNADNRTGWASIPPQGVTSVSAPSEGPELAEGCFSAPSASKPFLFARRSQIMSSSNGVILSWCPGASRPP
jgi:hypothetical protein